MGRVIIFPTDTVYGIGTQIFDIEGIKRIYEIKNRPLDKPLACLCANLEQIESISYVTEDAKKLINKFLPGGLTLILESKEEVKDKIGYKTIGVRIPNSKIALKILEENGPMLTTSVNDSGETPMNHYDEIVNKYCKLVDKIYDNDSKILEIPSTVVMIVNGKVNILREGTIKMDEIKRVLN
ncbi:MAG: threonylcarbamoyl-AMP synthase [Acholeplasmatales bacterium]|nr:threonylcarbamoyl-AMP synthase [Acholeplasmatales bacterium]